MVHVSPDTPYMKLFEKFLAKKYHMAVDAWGTDDTHVKVYTLQHDIPLLISFLPAAYL